MLNFERGGQPQCWVSIVSFETDRSSELGTEETYWIPTTQLVEESSDEVSSDQRYRLVSY